MPIKTSDAIIIIIVTSLVLVTTIGNYFLHQRVLDRVEMFDNVLTNGSREVIMASTRTTKWICNGNKESLTTTRGNNESLEDWLERHQEAVEAAQKLCPPD